jgi:gliding motility-associated-like protein
MQVTVYPVPQAKLNVASLRYKQPNMKVSMFADSVPGDDVRYSWNYGDQSGDVWKDNSDFKKTQIHEYSTYGPYTIVLDVSSKHCATSDTAKIIIEPAAPSRTVGPKSDKGCNPSLHELVEGVNFADSVRWDIYYSGDTTTLEASFVVPDGQNGTYLFNKVGRYLMYQYAYGPGVKGEAYMRTDTMVINPTPKAEFSIRPDTVRLPNIPLFTSNTSEGAVSYKWNFGDGVTSDEMEPTHYYTTAGDYYVSLEVSSEHNCSDKASEKHVRVEPEGMLRFPTAFVPDPSGPCGGVETKFHNYVFLPYPRNGVKEGTYILEIFNRYGEKIYESHDPNIGWDGYYRGELCKQDVYVFKCRCTFENGKIFKQIGNVTLLR